MGSRVILMGMGLSWLGYIGENLGQTTEKNKTFVRIGKTDGCLEQGKNDGIWVEKRPDFRSGPGSLPAFLREGG